MVFEKRPIIAAITGCMRPADVYSAAGGAACTFSPTESLKPPPYPASVSPPRPWAPLVQPPVQGGDPLAIWPVVSSVQPPYTACRPAGPGGYLTDVLSTRHRGGSTQRTVAGQGPAAPPGRGCVHGFGGCSGKIISPRTKWPKL